MFADPAFWVLISFVLFVALLVYLKVPGQMTSALDKRADAIRDELEEARRLREEAQAILADYQRKQREAEQSADEIIAQAKREAEALTAETRKELADSLERRTKLAEEKIARAEAQAMDEVRAATVNVAIAAAEKVIAKNVSGDRANSLIDETIKGLKSKLN